MTSYLYEGSSISRIILIDDDALTIHLNKRVILYGIGEIPVDAFLDVDSALYFLNKYDQKGDCLIFLDINMPEKNGFDFLDEYRNFNVKSKVIMLSSSSIPDELSRVNDYDEVIDFVTKPLTFNYLESKFNMRLSTL